MRFMVVETFRHGAEPVYARAAAQGRMLPPGVRYVDSWVDERLERCFQLMEADDPALLASWTAQWSDVVEFEIVPVVASAEAAARVGRALTEAPRRLDGVLETVLYYQEGQEDALERFYRDVLGLRALGRGRWSLSFRTGAGVLLLFEATRASTQDWPPAHGATGVVHTCFLAAPGDYEWWRESLPDGGVEIVDEITWDASGLRSFYFRDPAGNMLEIAEGDLWP